MSQIRVIEQGGGAGFGSTYIKFEPGQQIRGMCRDCQWFQNLGDNSIGTDCNGVCPRGVATAVVQAENYDQVKSGQAAKSGCGVDEEFRQLIP